MRVHFWPMMPIFFKLMMWLERKGDLEYDDIEAI
jgi:hypothetical protein